MKVIRSIVIGSLIGGFVAIFIVWSFIDPIPNLDFEFFLDHLVVLAGIAGAVFGALVGLVIGVLKVMWDRLHRTVS